MSQRVMSPTLLFVGVRIDYFLKPIFPIVGLLEIKAFQMFHTVILCVSTPLAWQYPISICTHRYASFTVMYSTTYTYYLMKGNKLECSRI